MVVNCRTVKAVEIGLMANKYGVGLPGVWYACIMMVAVVYASAESLGGGLYGQLFDGRLLWSGGVFKTCVERSVGPG